jgi:hypothetical protein
MAEILYAAQGKVYCKTPWLQDQGQGTQEPLVVPLTNLETLIQRHRQVCPADVQ